MLISLENCFNLLVDRNDKSAPAMPVWTAEGTVNLSVESVAVDTVKTTPFERRFNPYDFNGG